MSAAAQWTVRSGDGEQLDEVIARMGEVARGAAADGRAFVNGKRARGSDAVKAGDEIVVFAARSPDESGEEVCILERARGILFANKPASMPTTPDRRGDRSLLGDLAALLAVETGRAMAPHQVHAASRLDVGVSGVVLCAIGEYAQKHVAAMREQGKIRRVYVGIASGSIEGEGTWDARIGRVAERSGRSRPVAGGRDSESAATTFRVLAHARGASSRQGATSTTSLLRLAPITGRMHQLRVHAAGAGVPLLGDREHGGPRTLIDAKGRVISLARIALHALAVELPGDDGEPLRAIAPPPADLRALWSSLDGDDAAWDDLAPFAPR